MKIKRYLLLVASLCIFGSAHAELDVIQDIVYANNGDREMLLDIYKPKDQSGELPAIVWIHGGGWANGSKINSRKQSAYLAERGYVVAAINYTLSDVAPFPAHIHDCKAAVRFLRANAEKYGIDSKQIGATGHSAGGHLAALLATSAGVKELEGEGGNADFSSAIQAAVPMGAQSDLETERIRYMTAQSGAGIWHSFLEGSMDKNLKLYQLASPRRHLDPSDPPMMFITGGKDNLDTHAEPIRMDMRRLEITTGLLVIPDAPHGIFSKEAKDWWREMALGSAAVFFDEYLKKAE